MTPGQIFFFLARSYARVNLQERPPLLYQNNPYAADQNQHGSGVILGGGGGAQKKPEHGISYPDASSGALICHLFSRLWVD